MTQEPAPSDDPSPSREGSSPPPRASRPAWPPPAEPQRRDAAPPRSASSFDPSSAIDRLAMPPVAPPVTSAGDAEPVPVGRVGQRVPMDDIDREPRRRRGRGLLAGLVALAVLAGSTVAGYGAAVLISQSVAASPVAHPGPTTAPIATRSPRPSSPRPSPSTAPTPSAAASRSPAPSRSPRPRASNVVHTVAAGETLSIIARRYGVQVQAIIDANDISDPNRILVGQRLTIPSPTR